MTQADDVNPSDLLLRDPLGRVTRSERRSLLGVSVIGILIAKTGLLPTKISAIGVEFTIGHQQAILIILTLVIGYFLSAFVLYATTDFLAWRMKNARISRKYEMLVMKINKLPSDKRQKAIEHADTLVKAAEMGPKEPGTRLLQSTSWLRMVFEFIIPIVTAGYAIFSLLTTAA